MKIDINTTEEKYTTLWLVIWQGALKLTPREIEVMAAVLDKYIELDKAGLKSPYIFKLCFDADARKEYCERLGVSSFNLTNILSGLKEKGAIQENDGLLIIATQLLPKEEITFRFVK